MNLINFQMEVSPQEFEVPDAAEIVEIGFAQAAACFQYSSVLADPEILSQTSDSSSEEEMSCDDEEIEDHINPEMNENSPGDDVLNGEIQNFDKIAPDAGEKLNENHFETDFKETTSSIGEDVEFTEENDSDSNNLPELSRANHLEKNNNSVTRENHFIRENSLPKETRVLEDEKYDFPLQILEISEENQEISDEYHEFIVERQELRNSNEEDCSEKQDFIEENEFTREDNEFSEEHRQTTDANLKFIGENQEITDKNQDFLEGNLVITEENHDFMEGNREITGENPDFMEENREITGENQDFIQQNHEQKSYFVKETRQFIEENPEIAGGDQQFTTEILEITGKYPEITGENQEFTDESKEFTVENQEFIEENQTVADKNGEFTAENPEITGKNLEFTGENPEFTGDNPEFTGDNPEFTGENPESTVENLEFTGENPEFTGENPETTRENPEITGQNQKFTDEINKSTEEIQEITSETSEDIQDNLSTKQSAVGLDPNEIVTSIQVDEIEIYDFAEENELIIDEAHESPEGKAEFSEGDDDIVGVRVEIIEDDHEIYFEDSAPAIVEDEIIFEGIVSATAKANDGINNAHKILLISKPDVVEASQRINIQQVDSTDVHCQNQNHKRGCSILENNLQDQHSQVTSGNDCCLPKYPCHLLKKPKHCSQSNPHEMFDDLFEDTPANHNLNAKSASSTLTLHYDVINDLSCSDKTKTMSRSGTPMEIQNLDSHQELADQGRSTPDMSGYEIIRDPHSTRSSVIQSTSLALQNPCGVTRTTSVIHYIGKNYGGQDNNCGSAIPKIPVITLDDSSSEDDGFAVPVQHVYYPLNVCICCKSIIRRGKSRDNDNKPENPDVRHNCLTCGHSFATIARLRRHLVRHDDKRFHCSECSKRFCTQQELRRHSVVHSYQRPYQCPHCAEAFRQSSTYYSHLRSHSLCESCCCINVQK